MARLPRLELPGVPLHIVQRGNNRAPCFFTEDDYRFYLDCLAKAAAKCGCDIHAYVLMTNHVHLLVTPHKAHAASRLMQHIGRRFVRAINERHGRTGSLWEGRFRSSLIESERYFLICQRYIELNPVRARIADHSRDYLWSSHRHYAEGVPDQLTTAHDCYLRLGSTVAERQETYRRLFAEELDPCVLEVIRKAANRGRPLGSDPIRTKATSAIRTIRAALQEDLL